MQAALFGDAPIPYETERIAHRIFPDGNLVMQIRDHFGMLYHNQQFLHLFSRVGHPALAPARLALVTVLQFVEGLSDRQAAEAVQDRISWKYALGLSLDDPGFHFSALSTFRQRLMDGEAEDILFETVLDHLRTAGLLTAGGRQRTDSTHVVAAVRSLNRLERVSETLRHALNVVAQEAPAWLRTQVPIGWYERYGQPIESFRLPKTDAARMTLATTIGTDGLTLLAWVTASTCPAGVADLPSIQTLRQVWADHFATDEGIVEWRAVSDLPPTAEQIVSPHDVDARWSTKRDIEWIGYKVHFTETCDDTTPHLLTNVETTVATTPDDNMLEPIHAQLAARDLLPREHLVDKGYTNAHALLTSQTEHGVTVVGPVAADPSWQAHAGAGFAKGDFQVDWAAERVTCPQGHQSAKWVTAPGDDPIVHVAFARSTCKVCPVRSKCTTSAVEPRQLTLQGEALESVLRRQRVYQQTVEFQEQYRTRAGIEGTHSQAIQRCDLRHARYRGLSKTRLQHLVIAVAINLVRAVAWLAELPLARTRTSAFAALHFSGA